MPASLVHPPVPSAAGPAGPAGPPPTDPPEYQQLNRRLYDDTFNVAWKTIVFDGIHHGREFINLGGAEMLDFMAQRGALGPGASILEIGSGTGAVAVYLAERFGCHVRGLDLNRSQVRHAQKALQQAVLPLGATVRFEHADATTWPVQTRHDAVLLIDVMMLLENPRSVVAAARRALRPGGPLLVSTLSAEDGLTPEDRHWLRKEDGMIGLLSSEDYTRLCAACDFHRTAVMDWTPQAIDSTRRMQAQLAANEHRIATAMGADVVAEWAASLEFYHRRFASGALRYLVLEGRA